MTTTTDELVTDEIRLKVAKAIYWDMMCVMHDHEDLWRKANQVIWFSAADAALRVAPSLIARGLRAAADRVGQGYPDYDQRGMTAFQMGRMASEIYGMAAKIQMPLAAQKGEK